MPSQRVGTAFVVCAPSVDARRANRTLTPEETARNYPVELRGVVTDDVPSPDLVVQDATAGCVEGNSSRHFKHHWGNLVEIEGITGPGKFAPIIREKKIRVLGKGTLPPMRVYTFGEIAGGERDSQWSANSYLI